MMRCPTCSTELVQEKYEDQLVRNCENCKGYLVDQKRLSIILNSRMESNVKLEEAASESLDSLNSADCPKCGQQMRKQPMGSTKRDDDRFWVDACKTCELLWFNGGELAQLQLNYESSSIADERSEAIRKGKAAEPLVESEITSNPLSAAPEITMIGLFIGLIVLGVLTVGLKSFGYSLLAGGTCLLITGIGVFLALQLIEEVVQERIAAIGLGVIGIAGALYLAFF